MRRIMQVGDIVELPNLGLVILGTNSELDKMSEEEIRELIGESVTLCGENCSTTIVSVLSISVASSLIGQKNVGIQLGRDFKISDIKPGTVVFTQP